MKGRLFTPRMILADLGRDAILTPGDDLVPSFLPKALPGLPGGGEGGSGRSLALNPPGLPVWGRIDKGSHPHSKGSHPHSYGDVLDLLMEVPEAERVRTLGEVSEVLAGRRAECRVVSRDGSSVVIEHRPSPTDEQGRSMMRAACALTQFIHWALSGLVLERPQGSRWHECNEAAVGGRLAVAGFGPQAQRGAGPAIETEGVLLLEHDWSAALRADAEGDVRWPYTIWVLEMRLSGRRVCALLVDAEELRDQLTVVTQGTRASCPYMLLFVETRYEGWALPTTFDWLGGKWVPYGARRHPLEAAAEEALLAVVTAQLRAVCIALDAEVAEREVVRAPEKLNKQRVRAGKFPLSDYHTVNLARRHRADRSPERADEDKRQSPRMHYRRGHWRHYDNRRVWIKWQLVGDPSLGFIDKHYRL